MKILIALFATEDTLNPPHIVAAADEAALLKKAINWCKERYCMHDATALGILTLDQVCEWFVSEVGDSPDNIDSNSFFIHIYTEEI